ncbi:hypothetical protein KR222_001002 [Zaprionus bogoriensis]|nr:hypothetical protein KR222_001002 [Zaprionus bogoriensis]
MLQEANEPEPKPDLNFATYTTEAPVQQFFVKNYQCRIPFIDPFSAEAMEIYKPQKFEACSNETALVQPIFDVYSKRYTLQINHSLAVQKLKSAHKEYNCFYQEIIRDAKRDNYAPLLPRIYFTHNYVIPLHVEGLIVQCYQASNMKNILQSDGYALVQYKPPPAEQPEEKSSRRKPSVIMFGMDTMSRINLRRTMPKVFKFLSQHGWYELQGHTKVADNTFPNLMAALSGFSPETAFEKVCDTGKLGCLDEFPFIWKYLKNNGYLTAYGEDALSINTFNLNKQGFFRPPFDYYLRHFLGAFGEELPSWTCEKCYWDHCFGRRIQSSYVYDFMVEFAKRYAAERPIWGLFWSNSFTHEDFAMPSKMDEYILQYLLDFEQNNVLDESIVIFFSDHGIRYGPLMDLSSGLLDTSLPMLFIHLPPWFRKQYPEYAAALQLNRNRLTSHFDLFQTLMHIVDLGRLENSVPLPRANDCPQCQSLFHPVKENRTCAEAGIPRDYCVCRPYKRIAQPWTDRIVRGTIERINDFLWSKKLNNICKNLTLFEQRTGMEIAPDMNFHDEPPNGEYYYQIKFTVQQNEAKFSAIVKFNNITGKLDVNLETIGRLNEYMLDSLCVNGKLEKFFCICSNLPALPSK